MRQQFLLSRIIRQYEFPLNLAVHVLNRLPTQNPAEITDGAMHAINTTLPEREKYVILAIYRDGKTLDEVGCKLGFSRERARQIRNRAVYALHVSDYCFLPDYTPPAQQRNSEQSTTQMTKRIEEVDRILREYLMLCTSNANASPIDDKSPITELHLASQTTIWLRRNGIHTIGDLKTTDIDMLPKNAHIGTNRIASLKKAMRLAGLHSVLNEDKTHTILGVPLPKHAIKKLESEGITTIKELCKLSPDSLSCIDGIGLKDVENIVLMLRSWGLSLNAA